MLTSTCALRLLLKRSWHDLAQRELDVLLVLVLVGSHHKAAKELECGLALVDARVFDTDLKKGL